MSTPPTTVPALAEAIEWASVILHGVGATAVAVIAVACLGLLLLNGRLPVRRGITTLIGCFILFAAGTLANALTAGLETVDVGPAPPFGPQALYMPTIPKVAPYDPYAGASVPTRPADPSPIR